MGSGNDDQIQVKGNQPTLFQASTEVVQRQPALSTVSSDERSRGRQERRTVDVFQTPASLMEDWTGLQRIMHIDRIIYREGKTSETHSYYISSGLFRCGCGLC